MKTNSFWEFEALSKLVLEATKNSASSRSTARRLEERPFHAAGQWRSQLARFLSKPRVTRVLLLPAMLIKPLGNFA